MNIEEKVSKEPMSGCWIWTGAINSYGYGRVYMPNGKREMAHRVSYQLFVGEIPGESLVLHKCDVRCCVNPSHLFCGTHADNTADMLSKNRNDPCRGTRNGHAKLSEKEVKDIRAARETGLSLMKVAKLFGISDTHVHHICTGQKWSHVI